VSDRDELLARGGVRVDWTGSADEPVVTVTLDRPETRNAQTPDTWRALAAVGEELPEGTRAVVLRGQGPVFSSGIDLRAFTAEGLDGDSLLRTFLSPDDDAALDLIAGFQRGFTWWHDRDDVVTIAVVQGAAVGAGFQLALACDLRVCGPEARFAMRETSLGLVPDLAGTHPLVRTVGYAHALEICLSGRWVGADEAQRLGLATVVAATDELDSTAARLAAAVTSAGPAAAAATKGLMRSALALDVDAQRRAERVAQLPLLRDLARGAGIVG
jgi:enoyl-CoA hydratase/carnithine racemase